MWIGGYDDWTLDEQREWDRDSAELKAERERRELTAKTENEKENTVKMDTRPWKIDPSMEKLYQDVINKNVTEKTTRISLQSYSCTYLDKPCSVEFLPGMCVKEVLQTLMRVVATEIDKKLGHETVLKGSFYTRLIFEDS